MEGQQQFICINVWYKTDTFYQPFLLMMKHDRYSYLDEYYSFLQYAKSSFCQNTKVSQSCSGWFKNKHMKI